MAAIHLTLEGEEAVFSWKDGKVYTEGYDLESEKTALALTRFGKGIGVLLVASNDCCKSEAEFVSEGALFVAGQKKIPSNKYGVWPEGQVLFEYYSYSSDSHIRWQGLEGARLSERHYKRILADPGMEIKANMARLIDLPEKYFHTLLTLSILDINYALVHNKSCPIDIIEILSSDKDEWVRWRVALNPTCPERILEILTKDTNETVRATARNNLATAKGLEV